MSTEKVRGLGVEPVGWEVDLVGSGWGEALGGRRGQVAGDSSPEDRPQQLPFRRKQLTCQCGTSKTSMWHNTPLREYVGKLIDYVSFLIIRRSEYNMPIQTSLRVGTNGCLPECGFSYPFSALFHWVRTL